MSDSAKARQPWLYGPWQDTLFILLPAFAVTALVLVWPRVFQTTEAVSPAAWLLLVVFVDVAHVYSSLYRTYFDPEEFRRYKRPLLLIPVIGWAAGIAVYAVDGLWFWRILAYLAVYHFVRQQYGFLRLYARHENAASDSRWPRLIDGFAIYMATLYPLVHWHCHPGKPFQWFVEGDFLGLPYPILERIAQGLWALSLVLYLAKEIRTLWVHRRFNLPRNAVVLGTVLSWYVGIVLAQGDLAFTVTNVVSHGIPYMALVWMFGRKKTLAAPRKGWIFKPAALPLFVGLLLLLGYVEEGLWDGWVSREHGMIFPWTEGWTQVRQHWLLAVVVPLLTVPQLTHYLIDGFIWKIRRRGSEVSQTLK
jgi:hypothetical protein